MTHGNNIWIDLDNTPHVPFFRLIIREMEARGHTVTVTARKAFQICELADLFGMQYVTIGHHYGKNPFLKVEGLGLSEHRTGNGTVSCACGVSTR